MARSRARPTTGRRDLLRRTPAEEILARRRGREQRRALGDADEILVGGFEVGVCQALGVHLVRVSVMPRNRQTWSAATRAIVGECAKRSTPCHRGPSTAPRSAGSWLGRNEPYWCGSEKKYKNSHLASDEERSAVAGADTDAETEATSVTWLLLARRGVATAQRDDSGSATPAGFEPARGARKKLKCGAAFAVISE